MKIITLSQKNIKTKLFQNTDTTSVANLVAKTLMTTNIQVYSAGVGDTIFGVILPTIFGSIGAYMGLHGNPIGAIIWLLVNFAVLFLRFSLLPLGYSQGEKLIYAAGDKLNKITDSAILLGVTVVGALIPTVVSVKVPLVFRTGKVTLKAQSILNQIMPSLVPVILVAICYWLLGKKKMNSTRLIVSVLIVGIILGGLGILSK
ncbi:hypothetical protein CPBBRM18_IMEEAPEM_01193 [Companilactobacillus paralimentarius]